MITHGLAAVLATFTIGSTAPHTATKVPQRGENVAFAMPPHSYLQDDSTCEWIGYDHVTDTANFTLKMHWNRDHDIQMWGGSVYFDGITFTNDSTHWVDFYGRMFKGGKCNPTQEAF